MGKIRDIKSFSTVEQLPRLTQLGYQLIMIPNEAKELVDYCYSKLVNAIPQSEPLNNHSGVRAELLPLDNFPKESKRILELLQPMHEEWCGQFLEPSIIWGIRSYLPGSTLPIHTDHLSSHHIASTILVDAEQEEEWELNFQKHDGEVVSITQNPGGMVMYEAAKCRHARLSPFKGKYYRNFYVHYRLKDWKYNK
tara:strand:+ start:1023 stop:1607 length:585 start_codon:yes stop_codon:yes gene_type:complete